LTVSFLRPQLFFHMPPANVYAVG